MEHDSTSDVENEPEPQTSAATKDENQHQFSTQASADLAIKAREQSPISSLNTHDIEGLNKLISD